MLIVSVIYCQGYDCYRKIIRIRWSFADAFTAEKPRQQSDINCLF